MPTYIFRCPKCETQIEIVQRISERKEPMCVKEGCDGGIQMESVIGPTSFLLKGSCWAKDGYK